MPTYLADILAAHRARAEADGRALTDLVEQAASTPPPRDFVGALRGDGLSCIAEIKRRSPSKGDLDPGLQADLVAKDYVAGGAACLSVLTDVDFFGGSAADLAAARDASGLPVLRKDFTVQEADVADARRMGADAVLLIAAALSDAELAGCATLADQLGLAALVEVHDEEELARALDAGAGLVGVNQRDLRTFQRRSRPCLRAGGAHPARGRRRGRVGHPRWRRRPAARRGGLRRHPGRRDPRAGGGPPRPAPPAGRVSRRNKMTEGLFVKICGITSEADALLSVSLGASAVGFIFAPSPRQVSVHLAGDIAKRLPEHVLTVGVFRDEAPQRIVEAVRVAGLGAAQLHGHETAEETKWVRARVPTVIKAFPAGDRTIVRFEDFGADYLLVDGENPGSGQVFDWRLAEGVTDPTRMIVSGGLRPDNVADAVAHLRPGGVDVASGVEAAPGRKDPLLLRNFIANARRAEAALAARDPLDDPVAEEPYDWRDA